MEGLGGRRFTLSLHILSDKPHAERLARNKPGITGATIQARGIGLSVRGMEERETPRQLQQDLRR